MVCLRVSHFRILPVEIPVLEASLGTVSTLRALSLLGILQIALEMFKYFIIVKCFGVVRGVLFSLSLLYINSRIGDCI